MPLAAEEFIAWRSAPDLVIGNACISHGTLTCHGAETEAFKDILETNVVGLVHTFSPSCQGDARATKGFSEMLRQMIIVGRALRLRRHWLFDRHFAKAGLEPRLK